MAAFLANIGANSSHSAQSRLNPDGSFAVLPIPERCAWSPPMLRACDAGFGDQIPNAWRDKAVHLDPDLGGPVPTYGDNCRTAGRAFSLRAAGGGDTIWFLARLHDGESAALHLVGRLHVDAVLDDVTADPGPGWWDRNAHVRRGRATGAWNSFWVFRGSAESGWLPRARPFGRPQAETLFGRWAWPDTATEQQVIAWHTRAVRRIDAAALAGILAAA